MNCVERFSGHVLEADEADERPVWLEHGTTYVYIKYNNLYIMAVTQRNSNAAMILLFLYRLVEVLKDYFRELEEESIRDNFVITYEVCRRRRRRRRRTVPRCVALRLRAGHAGAASSIRHTPSRPPGWHISLRPLPAHRTEFPWRRS